MSLNKRFSGVRTELEYLLNIILIFSRFTGQPRARATLSLPKYENMRIAYNERHRRNQSTNKRLKDIIMGMRI
jgi:hypothetical protein